MKYTIKATIISGLPFYKIVKIKKIWFITYYLGTDYLYSSFAKADKKCIELNHSNI